jgi:single-strand DNA-binding protein
MTSLRNSVHLIGRLGADPEVIEFESGKNKARFSLATTDVVYDKSGSRVEDTQWHNVVAWGNLAKIAADYLKKGKEIAIEGKLTNRKYEDKNGQLKYFTEIVANEILMLDRKN